MINGKELNSHNNSLIFLEYNARISLNEGENEIKFTPEGDFSFQCSTGTLKGYVKVVEDINKISIDDIKADVENYQPPSTGLGGGASCH